MTLKARKQGLKTAFVGNKSQEQATVLSKFARTKSGRKRKGRINYLPRDVDLAGHRFGALVVLSNCPSRPGHSARRVVTKCDCGAESVRKASDLWRGALRSCGCLYTATQDTNFTRSGKKRM